MGHGWKKAAILGALMIAVGVAVYALIDDMNNTYQISAVLLAAVSVVLAVIGLHSLLIIRKKNHHLTSVQHVMASTAKSLEQDVLNGLVGLKWAQEAAGQYSNKPFPHKKFNDELQKLITQINYLLDTTTDRRKISSNIVESLDLQSLLMLIVHSLEDTAKQRDTLIMLDSSWPTTSGKVVVQADRSRMQRVFTNLIGNAIKYSKKGSPVTVTYQKTNSTHEISITDSGVGIPVKDQAHIFEKGFRGGNARDDEFGEHSLGLHIIKQLVEDSDGSISYESQPGHGTTFMVSMPIHAIETNKMQK